MWRKANLSRRDINRKLLTLSEECSHRYVAVPIQTTLIDGLIRSHCG
jgi:hypothetical protein